MLTNPVALFELMEKAGSKMILYDPSLEHLTADCPFSKMVLIPIELIDGPSTVDGYSTLPGIEDLSSNSDICFIYHTSGSTSGSPKVVPWTHKAFTATYKIRSGVWLEGERFNTQDVFLGLVSVSHRPGMTRKYFLELPHHIQDAHAHPISEYLRCLDTGSSFIKPSRGPLPDAELLNIYNLCGLNRITTYGTWISPHISAAKKDPTILKMLQEMRTISYTGVAISKADDDWCFQNGIPIVVRYFTLPSVLLF